MTALTREEIEKMHDSLRKAFLTASSNWEAISYAYNGDATKRQAGRDLAVAAGALLQADERLREFDRDLIAKPAAPKLQAKT